jgi:hypothetical protein
MNTKQGENLQFESVIKIRTNFLSASYNYPKHVANGSQPIHD